MAAWLAYLKSRLLLPDLGGEDEPTGEEMAAALAFQMQRLVNRNDDAVDAVLINGKLAYQREQGYAADLGKVTGYGQFLPARSEQEIAGLSSAVQA